MGNRYPEMWRQLERAARAAGHKQREGEPSLSFLTRILSIPPRDAAPNMGGSLNSDSPRSRARAAKAHPAN
jgi:hypothetical protein